jgi:hypothetical protein
MTPPGRRTTTYLAPPPPRFSSTERSSRSEEVRLDAEDERVLDEIWDARAAEYERECQAREGAPTAQQDEVASTLAHAATAGE